tara:strand:+ start:7510 stop:7692 length:183 start_codon:yes stop_codon:yes gene_type:complete
MDRRKSKLREINPLFGSCVTYWAKKKTSLRLETKFKHKNKKNNYQINRKKLKDIAKSYKE